MTSNLPLLKFITALILITIAVCSTLFNLTLVPAETLPLKPVLAFEFARDSTDLVKLFINADRSPACQFVKDIRFSIVIDFPFIMAYVSFMMLLGFEILVINKRTLLGLSSILLAVVVGIFDVLENFEMCKITDVAFDFPQDLNDLSTINLQIFTWTKWLASGVYLGLLAVHLWKQKLLFKMLSTVACITFVLSIVAFLSRSSESRPLLVPFTSGILFCLGTLAINATVRFFSSNWKTK